MTRTILVIDDETNMRWVLSRALEQAGYTAHSAAGGDEGMGIISREPVDLVLLDLKLKGEDGLVVLRRIRQRYPDVVVIMLTAYGTVPAAVEAMQLGAADFLRKPFDVEDVTFKVTRALERRAMQQQLAQLTVVQQRGPAFNTLVGASTEWRTLIDQAQQVAAMDDDVLLTGERGTGRASLARAIHVTSPRCHAPLVALDLRVYQPSAHIAALVGSTGNGGAWAAAGSGSLVIRGAMAQVQEQLGARMQGRGRVGPRVLLVEERSEPAPPSLASWFPVHLSVPPLRERPGDALLLARHFAGDTSITAAATRLIEGYPWPGNVAELRGVIERALRLTDEGSIDITHMPEALQMVQHTPAQQLLHVISEGMGLEQLEQALIRQALEHAHGNKSRAADLLGITRSALIYRMEKYQIVAPERE